MKKIIKWITEWKLIKAILGKLRGKGDKDSGINA